MRLSLLLCGLGRSEEIRELILSNQGKIRMVVDGRMLGLMYVYVEMFGGTRRVPGTECGSGGYLM